MCTEGTHWSICLLSVSQYVEQILVPCKNLLAIAPRSRRDDRDRGAMAAIAARLCISRRDLD